MVQYIHFRILEFPLKKYRCFLGTPCPPLSEDKCISSLGKKMPASSSLNMMPISVRLCKKHMTRSPQFLCQLCFQNMLETHKRCVTFFLSCIFCWKPFLSQNRLKPFESFWAKIHHEFWSMLKHLKQTDTRHRWVPSGTPKNDQVPGAPKAVN